MLSVLIVDDEPIARERLRVLLAEEPDIDIVGEAASVETAVRAIRRHEPDLVLLDIQLPGGDGFEVVRRVGPAAMPYVVFVTAYDEYAIRAFDVNAIDYLLKPFDGERLAAALARARERRATEAAAERGMRLTALAVRMLDRGAGAGTYADRRRAPRPGSRRLVVRSRGRIRLVDPDEIDWAEADRNYVRLHVAGETHLLRHTLVGLAERLGPERFVRIHRSTLVNLDRVVEMRHRASGEYIVELEDGTELKLSRTYRERFLERLGEEPR